MLINGQYPGPTLTAGKLPALLPSEVDAYIKSDWGDTLVVNVKNELQDNGTSIHFHGIRQLNTMQMDGANGVTECRLLYAVILPNELTRV